MITASKIRVRIGDVLLDNLDSFSYELHHPIAAVKIQEPICRTCGKRSVYNEVLGKPFYYCRTCKTEVGLPEPRRQQHSWLWQDDADDYRCSRCGNYRSRIKEQVYCD
jgi:ribosomal protein S14